MTASHAADAATDSDATSEAAPVTDTAAATAAAKDTAGGNGHTRRRRRFPWPSTFRGRLIATISIAALAMLATVIITQNIIVSQAARQQKNNIVMCTDKDTGKLITVYFDKNQTSSDLDLEDEPDAVGSSATAVCSPMLSVQEDTVETSDPESTVTKIEVTHIGKTASALTDSFITMMQFISIGTFIIFAVLSLIASWLVGSRLSKRVAKISKQVEALKPGDLDARIAPDGSDDEIGKLIESINGMLDRLQNATEAERRFVSNASHELRTPIAAVATNLDAPLSQGRFPADVEPAIRRALAANRRGSDLVQALLTLSRIQSGVIDTEDVTALQLADFIDDELAEVEEQADKRNILVTTRDVASDVQVQASKSLMDLAIGNLLRNAIMHNISSGTLDIAARQEHCAIIVTITNSTDETLPDDLMNLKQPFHRGEHSRISAEPGVGLGLSIADAACEAMGATLELDRPDEQSFRATITIASA
ncbi:HAMP domain-containing sensor histidine kinase [uncultured Bifidobacterium sp.]|uniref:sensor histidine kinase n=1 Tax=uncultured Bifidobacterium sp. TaxID=165187 RepID=UPI00258BFB23|nr:HAMP domain-containing sensor histidine kinase [uncultured Bifidobacterium sp.]